MHFTLLPATFTYSQDSRIDPAGSVAWNSTSLIASSSRHTEASVGDVGSFRQVLALAENMQDAADQEQRSENKFSHFVSGNYQTELNPKSLRLFISFSDEFRI